MKPATIIKNYPNTHKKVNFVGLGSSIVWYRYFHNKFMNPDYTPTPLTFEDIKEIAKNTKSAVGAVKIFIVIPDLYNPEEYGESVNDINLTISSKYICKSVGTLLNFNRINEYDEELNTNVYYKDFYYDNLEEDYQKLINKYKHIYGFVIC